GFCDQKSHCMVLSRRPFSGRRFWDRMKCGNFMGSRTKKTGVLFPIRSKLPSEVKNFRAKPRTSRQVSGEPSSPATIEKRANISDSTTAWNIPALEYVDISSVTVKVP